jgi:hypothetical protein
MADTADSRSTSHSKRGAAHESSPLKHTGSTAFCTECGAQKTLTSSQCFVFFLTLCFQFRRVPIHMHSSVMHASTHTQRSPSSTRRYLEKQRGTHFLHPHTNCAYVHVGCMYHTHARRSARLHSPPTWYPQPGPPSAPCAMPAP